VLAVAKCLSDLDLFPQRIETADSAALSWFLMRNGFAAID
jgi:hypothetical protein